jgi:hypothetical protein
MTYPSTTTSWHSVAPHIPHLSEIKGNLHAQSTFTPTSLYYTHLSLSSNKDFPVHCHSCHLRLLLQLKWNLPSSGLLHSIRWIHYNTCELDRIFQVISILKPGKVLALPSSYCTVSLLGTTGKLFEKILLARILSEIWKCGLLHDEQFWFRPKHSMSLKMARLIETVTMNFGKTQLTGTVFLDMARAFDTVWVTGLVYKLTDYNFHSHSVKNHFILPAWPNVRSILPGSHIQSWCHVGWRGTGWINLPCPLSSVCQHVYSFPSRWICFLSGRHGHHSHVLQASAACQLPGV